jgi:hypothetical protein
MEQNLKELIRKQKPDVKDSTINQYLANLKSLIKMFGNDNFKFLQKPDDIMEKLESKHYTTKRNFLNAIIIYLQATDEDAELIKEYQEQRDKFNEQYKDENQSKKISEKQKNNFVSLSVILDMLKKMEKDLRASKVKSKPTLKIYDKDLLNAYTIFSLLVKKPIRNDMADMTIISKVSYNKLKEDDKNNYLVRGKGEMFLVLNDYKTNKVYGRKKIDLDKETRMKLNSFIKIMGKKDGDILFTSNTGKALSRNSISQLLMKWSKHYLNKSISTQMMRKIVPSEEFGEMKKKQEELADVMCHSVQTQNAIYIKEQQ